MQRTVLPIEHLRAWAKLNGIKFNNVTVEKNIAAAGGEGKGAGVVATEDFSDDDGEEILMTVPADLILTKEQVKKQAALDKNIQRILDDAGEFGEVSNPPSNGQELLKVVWRLVSVDELTFAEL